jgi:hypothetical protein
MTITFPGYGMIYIPWCIVAIAVLMLLAVIITLRWLFRFMRRYQRNQAGQDTNGIGLFRIRQGHPW